jgi:hypothetical protein
MEEFLVETGWTLSHPTMWPSLDAQSPPPPALISSRSRIRS